MTANIVPKTDPALDTLMDKVRTGGIVTLSSLLSLTKSLVPIAEAPVVAVATPKEITDSQRAAIKHLPDVFAQVIPGEVRALEPAEVESLIDERMTLDEVKKMAEARLADITVTVHNHLDTEYADQITEDLTDRALKVAAAGGDESAVAVVRSAARDEKGHYIVEGTVGAPGQTKQFSREVRHGSPSLNTALLAALDTGEPDALITHEEYLSMTTQVRQFDEAKAMLAIRKNPALVQAIVKATEPGKDGVSVYLRNR